MKTKIEELKLQWEEFNEMYADRFPVSLANIKALLDELTDEELVSNWEITIDDVLSIVTKWDMASYHYGEIYFDEDGTFEYSVFHDGFICDFEPDGTDFLSETPWRRTECVPNVPFTVPRALEYMKRWEDTRIELAWEHCKAALLSTKRKGIENVVNQLDISDFIHAPASRNDHSNYRGGLLMHSIYVYNLALDTLDDIKNLRKDICFDTDSILITALLHDICKIGRYKLSDDGVTYTKTCDDFPIGHGEKSVILLLQWGLELTEEEIAAIRYHMGAFDIQLNNEEAKQNYFTACRKYPLVNILQVADTLAACVIEQS